MTPTNPEDWLRGDEPVSPADRGVYGAIRAHRAAERADKIRKGYADQGFDIDQKFAHRVTQVVLEELSRGAYRVGMACRECAKNNKSNSCDHNGRVKHLIVALPPIDWDAKMPRDDDYVVLAERIQDLLEETP